jgi:hypothetical protein
MLNVIKIILAISSMFRTENAIATSNNELMTADGNVWAVYDELEVNREYTLIFNSLGDNDIYNDEIVKII